MLVTCRQAGGLLVTNLMRNKNLIIIITVIVLAIFAGLWYKSWQAKNRVSNTLVQEQKEDYGVRTIVTAKHSFKDGTHIVTGEMDMPTPCDLLKSDVIIKESYPEQVTIKFSTINEADVCAKVITTQRFKVEFKASEKASISATLNGKDIILNLIEAGASENLEDFEVFIKG